MPNSPTKLQSLALFNSQDDVPNLQKTHSKSDISGKLENEISDENEDCLELPESESDSEPEQTMKPIKIKTAGLFKVNKLGKLPGDYSHGTPVKIKTSHLQEQQKKKHSQTKLNSKLLNSSLTVSDENNFEKSELCEALALRQRNIEERDAFLASFMNDPEFAEAIESIGLLKKESKERLETKPKIKKRRRHTDESFRFAGQIPVETRRSMRLQDKEPTYKAEDLVDENGYDYATKRRKRNHSSDDDYEYTDLEKVIYQPRNKSFNRSKATERTKFLYVEDVTENMIKNIAWRVSDKEYSTAGSSCHQCRQKTSDTKTFCRDKECVGVRGQFCGVCLENRYGENAASALKDPNWRCPVCRGICNCSFCRSKAGKRPTGILAPIAHRTGHKSVKDFLDSLRGEGDYADETMDPNNLLGFSKDLDYAHMGGNVKHHLFI